MRNTQQKCLLTVFTFESSLVLFMPNMKFLQHVESVSKRRLHLKKEVQDGDVSLPDFNTLLDSDLRRPIVFI